jgi:hypothetical protein
MAKKQQWPAFLFAKAGPIELFVQEVYRLMACNSSPILVRSPGELCARSLR